MAFVPFAVFCKGRQIGTMESANLMIKNNAGQQITLAGVFYSKGKITTDLDVSCITGTDGDTGPVLDAVLNQEEVSIQVGVVDGAIVSVTMTALEAGYKCTVKDGSVMGDFKFGGGKPTKD